MERLQISFDDLLLDSNYFDEAFEKFAWGDVCVSFPLSRLIDPIIYWFLDTVKRDVKLDKALGQLRYGQFFYDTEMKFRQFADEMLSPLIKLEIAIEEMMGKSGNTPLSVHDYAKDFLYGSNALRIISENDFQVKRIFKRAINWVVSRFILFERMLTDLHDLRSKIIKNETNLEIISIADEGDYHGGSNSVAIINFQNQRIVYKPRCIKALFAYQKILSMISDLSNGIDQYQIKLLVREGYGWMEFIETDSCQTEEQIERYYMRLGVVTSVLYLLKASDIHNENIISFGEFPVVFDVETIFQPKDLHSLSKIMDVDSEIFEKIRESVFKTSLFPTSVFTNFDVDFSGISGRDIDDSGKSRNIPRLRNTEVNPFNYRSHLIDGFETSYRNIIDNKETLLNIIEQLCTSSYSRLILRTTGVYYNILLKSYHPDNCKSKEDFMSLFAEVYESLHGYIDESVVDYEAKSILAGDIPLFLITWDDKILMGYSCEGGSRVLPIKHLSFNQSSILFQSISTFSDEDLARQKRFIMGAYAKLGMPEKHMYFLHKEPLLEGKADRHVNVDWRDPVKLCAEWICNDAIQSSDYSNWIAFNHRASSWRFGHSNLNLYDGLPGLAIFLAEAGRVLENDTYMDLSLKSANTFIDRIRTNRYNEDEFFSTQGILEGMGGALYCISKLSTLHSDNSYIEAIEKHIDKQKVLLMGASNLSLSMGVAGLLIGVIEILRIFDDMRLIELAEMCKDKIIHSSSISKDGLFFHCGQNDRVTLGLAHGNAGIALALHKYSTFFNDDSVNEVIFSALQYEDSHFDYAESNWPDEASETIQYDYRDKLAWAYGAPGCGLARLEIFGYNDHSRRLLDITARATLNYKMRRNNSLVSGNAGRLLYLYKYSLMSGDSSFMKDINNIKRYFYSVVSNKDWFCGTALSVPSPGMYNGIAGIGQAILQMENKSLCDIALLK